ncbi:putative N-carbamoyl-D-amino acid hydrolase [Teratosphaeria nubilosa]|uniref:Putative N-carbamoyl-D-amino acid hydrolase n=1 Tax=Teratosphaeria nubilosa TaxID=161662 RepID=A0A6G1LK20_9PEZI|nr:putative N-carbamoyl-D-amino acid hydrolase [Teratosphaeria nubilosa]
MSRRIKVAAAQVGAINRDTQKKEVVARLIGLLHSAAEQKVQLVVFPECTLTTFFPRHLFTSQEELDTFFERRVISKYRKVHLPGTKEPFEDPKAVNQLEKRYFTPGDLGFQPFRVPGLIPDALKKATAKEGEKTVGKGDPIMGTMICNDRRWPEAWRQYSLQGAELLMFGYNTGGNMAHLWGSKPMSPEEAQKEALFHSRLVQQANSYMNACFSISSARCGLDDGKYDLIGGSSIVSPEGHVVAEAKTTEDELVVAEIDLAECRQGKEKTFDFDRHRRIEAYGLINTQTGVVEPPLL